MRDEYFVTTMISVSVEPRVMSIQYLSVIRPWVNGDELRLESKYILTCIRSL
jgi:hypothetical protein